MRCGVTQHNYSGFGDAIVCARRSCAIDLARPWSISRDLLIGGMVCAMLAAPTLAAPQADIISSNWQLDFIFHDPQRITVQLPGDRQATTYWYLLFEATNSTGREVGFYPSFQLVTDTLRVVEGGADIHPRVYDAIVARHKSEFPFLAPPAAVTGPLLQGAENGRASVAVFRSFDPQASSFTIYAGGLSGEMARVFNPLALTGLTAPSAQPVSFLLRRTLAIHYGIPGDPESRASTTPIRRSREWVMR